MPAVEALGLSGQQAPHQGRQAGRTTENQEVRMIVQQRPGKNPGSHPLREAAQPRKKIISVPVVAEDFPSFDAPDHHMMERSRTVQPCLPWHIPFYPTNTPS